MLCPICIAKGYPKKTQKPKPTKIKLFNRNLKKD